MTDAFSHNPAKSRYELEVDGPASPSPTTSAAATAW
jgi:hypothetical protein